MTSPFPTPPTSASSHPTGELVVHVRPPFGGGRSMMSPVLTIDGFPAPAQWGRNAFPAPAGPRHVRVATHYLWKFGTAEQVVEVQPGRSTEVHYSGPLITFIGGRMGATEQPRPGQLAFWILMGFLGLVLLLGVVAAVIG